MAYQNVARAINTDIEKHKGVNTSNMKFVLCLLLDRADESGGSCFPSLQDLAERGQMSRSVVQKCIDGLIANGYLSKTRTRKTGGSLYGSNDYFLNISKLDDSINYRKKVTDVPSKGNCRTVERYHQVPSDGNKPVNEPVNEPIIKPVRNYHPIPEDFSITSDMKDWFSKKGYTFDIDTVTEKFINHAQSNGRKQKDWKASWRIWMLDEKAPTTYNNRKSTKPENFSGYGETQF